MICDRFLDSTLAYQGSAGGVPLATLEALIRAAIDDTRPDLTIVLDLTPNIGLQRAHGGREGAETRFERKGEAFHTAVREGFRRIAAREPERCAIVDAGGAEDAVAAAVAAAVSDRLGLAP